MGTMTISVKNEVEKDFRKVVEGLNEYRGMKKGYLGAAITEAMQKWIEEKKQRRIADEQMKLSEKGLYRLHKNWRLKRDEIYGRG